MKIKKIVAPDMQQAMQQIRRELGADAVIINTTREPVKGIKSLFGRRNVEVTAAVDDTPPNLSEPVPQARALPLPPEENVVRTRPVTGEAISAGGIPERVIPGRIRPSRLPEPILELSGAGYNSWFKTMLLRELDKEDIELENDYTARWKRILGGVEVNDSIADTLLEEYNPSLEQAGLPANDIFKVYLKDQIIKLVKQAYAKKNGARIHTFIGPTGVGKTMSLVKLATLGKVVKGKQIALIAVYNHRFGAMEKLNHYGNIIGLPVEVVMTPAELAQTLEAHRDKDLIFIDTEGRPSMNRSQVLELHSFVGAINEPQNMHLVLSAPTRNRDLLRIAGDFRPVGYNSIIFTKTDETDTFGTMLNLVCNTGVPVSHVANGQNVPDDIEELTPGRFAEIILGSIVLDEDSQT